MKTIINSVNRYVCAAALVFASLGLTAPHASAADAAVQAAVAALQRQDYTTAERTLRDELKLHPEDAETLSLLGVALDGQHKFSEALPLHLKAAANAPNVPGVLNNYANSLLSSGDEKGARETFLRTLAVDPADQYANLQLAHLALNQKDGRGALVYLDRLRDAPDAAIMRLLALDFAEDHAAAQLQFAQVADAAKNDPKLSTAYGTTLAKAGQFDQAETFLTQALSADPASVPLLYGVGVTAIQAGHLDRAREVLDSAVRLEPKNVDALYAVGFVCDALKQPESAIRALAAAAKLAPERADVQRLLAVTTGEIKAHEDSVAAWERYIKLAPNDDAGRRERGFEKAHMGLFDEAIPDLEWYAARHPDDAVGWYELGVSENANDPTRGLANLDRAIALRSDMVSARSARGNALYAQGKAEAALPDLEFAAAQTTLSPRARAAMLDKLGQTYLSMDRLKDALPVLRKAAELAPDDSATQLHLANALAEAGQTAESDGLMARFRELRPNGKAPPVRGVVDYLSLTPEQRHDDYKARLEKTIKDHPDDTNAQLLHLKLLLADGQMTDAAADARRFAALKPPASVLADAGHALLEAKLYAPAKELLAQASAGGVTSGVTSGVAIDLAIAAYHAGGSSDEGLRGLDAIAEPGRNANWYLARAQMLESAGKPAEAMTAMDAAVKAAPGRADLYWAAAALMAKNGRYDDALRLLSSAAFTLPQEVQIAAMQAAVTGLAGNSAAAQKLLDDAQHRWPESAPVWVVRGMTLVAARRFDEARRALETATALGAHSTEVWYALALSAYQTKPADLNVADHAIRQALQLSPDDASVKSLAARIPERAANGFPLPDPAALFLSKPPLDW